MPGSPSVWFATSNRHKFQEGCLILNEFGVHPRRLKTKGQELQSSDPAEVAAHAAVQSYSVHRRPLFVEDTALSVTHLRGFPGTYASFVFNTIGARGVLKLMSGVTNRSAEFISAVAYCDNSLEPKLFVGRLRGRVATQAAGREGFGFDPIFVPTEGEKTLAQMTLPEKCMVSHRAIALRAFGEWLSLNRTGQRLSAQDQRRGKKVEK